MTACRVTARKTTPCIHRMVRLRLMQLRLIWRKIMQLRLIRLRIIQLRPIWYRIMRLRPIRRRIMHQIMQSACRNQTPRINRHRTLIHKIILCKTFIHKIPRIMNRAAARRTVLHRTIRSARQTGTYKAAPAQPRYTVISRSCSSMTCANGIPAWEPTCLSSI